MGITWRINMVLLSTLAALVIIVHSAEEEYENQYRRGLRTRSLDTGTRRYEQPWRTLEIEPIMQESTSRAELEDMSSEEPPRRRRPGRKRKRRPEPISAEEASSERYTEDHVRPQFDDFSNERQTSERPKRRRKKIERRLKWADSLEEDRPIRRRGQRRKRPTTDTWPELSEFNVYRPNQAPRYADEEVTTDQVMTMNENKQDDSTGNTQRFTQKQPGVIVESREEIEIDDTKHSKRDDKYRKDNKKIESIYRSIEREDGFRLNSPVKDKSLSEFSMENLPSVPVVKSSEYYTESVKAQNNGPIDPLTLKDILKKSNGTSLSEILQQHNLSLADLLHGKELALSILKSESNIINQAAPTPKTTDTLANKPIQVNSEEKDTSEEKVLINSETKYVTESITEIPTTTFIPVTQTEEDLTTVEIMETTTTEKLQAETAKPIIMQRFPVRRKQRIRPVINNNYKSQLNRDMLALTARKYFYNNRRRNVTKSQEWRDVIPLMKNVTEIVSEKPKIIIETTTADVEVTTTFDNIEQENNASAIALNENNERNDTNTKITKTEASEVSQNETLSNNGKDQHKLETDKIKSIPSIPQAENASGLRRQAFNNILKKKRRKLKYSTTESPPQDDFMKNLFGIPNLVSSSEFIERTQGPKTSLDDVTILEDFITTQMPSHFEDKPKNLEPKPKIHENKHRKNRYSTRAPIHRQTIIPSSTEDSAKIEIEEILNDTWANARLSKILKERNMTLSELVEHRERGSSHVHLADIFHNASKEPNPPEPFLSKSAIEPISKETYPLRALLDAHDTTTRATTTDPMQDPNYVHIPIKMDFGNNVNENAENMGIMSLFHNITKPELKTDDANIILKDSQGTPYSTSVIVVNAADDQNETETVRESRVMHSIGENPDDIVGWSEILSLMRRNYENKTKELSETYLDGLIPAETIRKPSSEEDLDGDGLIVLEDLQRLNDFSNKITSIEELDMSAKRTEAPMNLPGISDKTTNQNHSINTKSITLATASIVGLALVLFLLTYIGYRWRQQRVVDKKNFPDERIPTPVFEHRKGHKHNSSTRSISPMLSSNIYTLSTLDSQNGKESPDYMWDSLRKPFQ